MVDAIHDSATVVHKGRMMNERIKELAIEADKYAERNIHYYNGQFDGLTWGQKIKQARDAKFAELIVKDCLKIVNRHEYSYHEADPLWETSQLIKEHFGVEKSRSQKLKEAGFTRRYKTWTKEKDDEI
jgi:hypothetical protein